MHIYRSFSLAVDSHYIISISLIVLIYQSKHYCLFHSDYSRYIYFSSDGQFFLCYWGDFPSTVRNVPFREGSCKVQTSKHWRREQPTRRRICQENKINGRVQSKPRTDVYSNHEDILNHRFGTEDDVQEELDVRAELLDAGLLMNSAGVQCSTAVDFAISF